MRRSRATGRVMCWLAVLAGTLFVAGGTLKLQADEKDGRLDIYFIDVEGGAATLIVTPAGESVLIDSGYPDNLGRDLNRILDVTRNVAGLEQIDHAVVSHWHRDHYGNHAALSTEIPIVNFWDRGIPDALPEDEAFVDRIADYRSAAQNESKTLRAGDKLPLKAGKLPLSYDVVVASREVVENEGAANKHAGLHEERERDETDNAMSLGGVLSFGDFRFVTCGDLTWNVEAKLVTPNNPLGVVDMFMVTHHGLSSSNNPAFVLAIDPVVTVMCNGPTKGGAPETLATLRQIESLQAMYQLHRNIAVGDDEQAAPEFIANSGKTENCQGVHIQASVAADGKSYTVQIGSDGEPRTFRTRAVSR